MKLPKPLSLSLIPLSLAAGFAISAVAIPSSSFRGPARIIDGDTLSISGIRFRLWGLDAPELSEPFGPAAKTYLESLTAGREIRCTPTGQKTYNRIVARCFIGDSDLAELMIRAGKALDCPRYSQGHYHPFEPYGIHLILHSKSYC